MSNGVASGSRWELADSHVHLDRYPPRAVNAMLARARGVGVRRFLTIGVDEATSRAAVVLARRRGLGAAVGIHPTRLGDPAEPGVPTWLRKLSTRRGVVAIGEVGLDEASAAPLADQERFLMACLELAMHRDLAVVLHLVGAHQRAQVLLAELRPPRAVVHYFQGDARLASSYLELGCDISVGKPATRPDRTALREAICQIPLERLLLETDTYPLPGRTTEPADVVEICKAVAELKGVAPAEVARATTANYRRLFGLP
jgi:TatD DNase family protein